MNDLKEILYILPGLILGLSLHEYAHALVAYKCGDESQKALGNLTMNPIKHIDVLGFLFILLFRFGWAKPVRLNTRALKKPKRDFVLISIAGPLANLLLAFALSFIQAVLYFLRILNEEVVYNSFFLACLYVFDAAVMMNLLLFVFNMLPVPGFDGYHAITAYLPARINEKLYRFESFGFVILLLLFVFPGALNFMYEILYFLGNLFLRLWSYPILWIFNSISG